MKNAQVVIGAGYGDEGKGLMTDALSRKMNGENLVVRFNGGAQAGHTVVAPDGTRHVFSHFGSGTLAGSPTYLSRFFVVNPLLYFKELNKLNGLGIDPTLLVDHEALVTTPYDMIINQWIEQNRGDKRHGSCGIGFGETIERSLNPLYSIKVKDLENRNLLISKLRLIKNDYVPARLIKLNAFSVPSDTERLLASDDLFERFIDDSEAFLRQITITTIDEVKQAKAIVFEGAQGLLLDQDRGHFPHVTRSWTGLKNVLTLAQEAGIDNLDVHYMTRGYKTRHGAGPLAYACDGAPWEGIEDKTNIDNPFQGKLKFGLLDITGLAKNIHDDLGDTKDYKDISVSHHLTITCLDQMPEQATFIVDEKETVGSRQALAHLADKAVGGNSTSLSFGPKASNIEKALL